MQGRQGPVTAQGCQEAASQKERFDSYLAQGTDLVAKRYRQKEKDKYPASPRLVGKTGVNHCG